MYLYKTTLFRDTTNVVNPPASNPADLADFENSHKANAYSITDIAIAETTLEVIKTYTDFENLITASVLWGDVKYKTNLQKYELFLLSENPL